MTKKYEYSKYEDYQDVKERVFSAYNPNGFIIEVFMSDGTIYNFETFREMKVYSCIMGDYVMYKNKRFYINQ